MSPRFKSVKASIFIQFSSVRPLKSRKTRFNLKSSNLIQSVCPCASVFLLSMSHVNSVPFDTVSLVPSIAEMGSDRRISKRPLVRSVFATADLFSRSTLMIIKSSHSVHTSVSKENVASPKIKSDST